VAGGRALDLTQPVVAKWVENEIERLIRTYHLDMFRIDHNHNLQPAGNRLYQGYTEDLIWRYYEALFGIFDRLREKFPQVVFQNCAGGGGRLDWGTLGRFHNSELSDWMRLPRGLKILNGVSVSLPPEILLRTFGTEVGEHVLDGDVDTQLRMCFSRIIFRGIAPSLDELTPYLRDRIEHYLAIYKTHIRPLMPESRVFHHTPCLPLSKTTPWCVLEYGQADRTTAVALVISTSAQGAGDQPDEYIFRPRGLSPACQYRVTLDNTGEELTRSGYELMHQGLPVRLEAPLSSELLLFKQV
jgi:alpha-galactosidase